MLWLYYNDKNYYWGGMDMVNKDVIKVCIGKIEELFE